MLGVSTKEHLGYEGVLRQPLYLSLGCLSQFKSFLVDAPPNLSLLAARIQYDPSESQYKLESLVKKSKMLIQ